jgi:amino acid adenylation domain-containing protein
VRRPSELRFPVSYAQQRLWLLDRLSPGSTLYVIPVTLRLTTAVDVEALARSLNEIARRHEVLRTTFELRDWELLQVIRPSLDVELPVVGLEHVAPGGREAAVMELAAREARRPFDLAAGPLLRATLFRLGPSDHLLFLAIHHIVADGWSLGLLFSELTAIYPAFVRGVPSPLPALPIQYADYAAWQRQRLEGGVLQDDLRYWRQQLAGLPAWSLPAGRRPGAAVEPASRKAMTLPPSTTARLAHVGRREGATLFMTLLAGFQALLHRCSGQEDFAVGTVIANRTRAETEALIGCFVNTVVIRARVAGGDTFRDLLRKARETTLSAYAHQELPFERLVEVLRPARDAERNPLVQILFSLQNTPSVSQHPIDQVRASWELDRGSANFDLTVDLWETREGLESRWEYRAALFDAAAIDRLMLYYGRLLEALAADPDRPIAGVALLDPDERRALLAQGSGRSVAFPVTPVHRCVAQRAAQRPARIAAATDTETLTYGQLHDRASRLARELRLRGVRRGDVVGIALARSPSVGVALLGVLGAGGAFVAIDPSDAAPRRAALLHDAHVRVVVSDTTLAGRLDLGAAEVVCLDVLDEPDSVALDAERPDVLGNLRADELAYLVYTSGSAGVPKGTLIPHGALANHCHAIARRYELGPEDRALQLAPIGFDVALEELLPVWLTGGMVQFPAQEAVLSFAELERCVERHGITLLNLPASYWHEWVDHLWRTQRRVPDSLRLVVCGSERVSTEKLRRWQALAGSDVRWMNAYGVTEATITSTTYEPSRPIAGDLPDIVPIGRPLANVHAYVLDDTGEPVPTGVVGELHLGGAGVALGYLGHPDLTAARFAASPFDPAPGARLYRTGDLVRFGHDGNLEFIGRRDAQVKVRGYRVELGEIEAVLMRHPGVLEAAVREPLDGSDRLVAYVVPSGPQPPDPSALAAHLQARLPGHMMPSAFVTLASLPRSAHGKIDRNALPMATDAMAARERVAPRNAIEARLAELWAAVLDRPQVGVTDNFFDLGGHSLLAMQLLSRVQAALAVEIPLRTLFEAPTVAGLAAALGQCQPATSSGAAIPIRDGARAGREPLPLDVDRLSDAEVDALLAELLDGEDDR